MTGRADDPYRILGVGRDATDAQIRDAYECRLADAAAAGAWRIAHSVDAAYSVLKDPRRRTLYDREGLVLDLPRLASRGRAVPFRAWSPDGNRHRAQHRRGRLYGALVILVAVAVAGVGVKFGVLRVAPAQALTGDVWQTASQSTATPPLHRSLHRTRLLPSVVAPAARGPYAFTFRGTAAPVRWDPCSPIRYVISGNEPFPGAAALLTSAINEVSADSGLQFVYAGTSSEVPNDHREPYQPRRYGEQWAPVLMAWTDPSVLSALKGPVAGIGGGAEADIEGQPRVVSGIVAFDSGDLARIAQRPGGPVEARTIMLHELGHLVGLAHVNDPAEVMNPTTTMPIAHYALGDRRGLAVLGAGACPSTY